MITTEAVELESFADRQARYLDAWDQLSPDQRAKILARRVDGESPASMLACGITSVCDVVELAMTLRTAESNGVLERKALRAALDVGVAIAPCAITAADIFAPPTPAHEWRIAQ